MVLDKKFLDELCAKAKQSPRLRMHCDMRTNPEEQSQRMLNALQIGTQIPVHRHPDTAETVVMLRGSVLEIFYDEAGNPEGSFLLKAGSDCCALQIPAGQWHSLVCLESDSVLFEAKGVPFQPRCPEDERPEIEVKTDM